MPRLQHAAKKIQYYKIKYADKVTGKWNATLMYPYTQPDLPRTLGYMAQCDIDVLPTEQELWVYLFKNKL